MTAAVYTIGHSKHSVEEFIGLLRGTGIAAIADVRSTPYSRRYPQFNREVLRASLDANRIAYVFLGVELGGRGNPCTEYDEHGRIQYRSIAESAPFRDGLQRVQAGSERMRLALMCAEGDPLDCHRGILISRLLLVHGMTVFHIHADGHLEPHSEAEERLLRLFGLQEPDLFRSRDQVLAEAYDRQEARIAYVVTKISATEEVVGCDFIP